MPHILLGEQKSEESDSLEEEEERFWKADLGQ